MLSPGVLYLKYEGVITPHVVRESLSEIKGLLHGRGVTVGLVDTTGVRRISGNIHSESQQILSYLKNAGMAELILVITSPVISMIVGATSFVTRLRVSTFDNAASANQHLAASRLRYGLPNVR